MRRDVDPSLYKLPPQSIETEQAVLGGMIQENETIIEVRKVISENDFYNDAHRKIFLAIIKAFDEQGKADLIILSDVLKQERQLDSVGGSVYLANLVDNFISSATMPQHCQIIKSKSVRRKIITGCSDMIDEAFDERIPLEEILGEMQKRHIELSGKLVSGETDQKFSMSLEHLNSYFADCRETPFDSLNFALGGMFPGEIIVGGARPGMGKSAFAHDILRHIAFQEERPVIYFGAQMSKEYIYARQLSAMCKIPYNILKRGRINNQQAKLLMEAQEKLNAAPIGEYIIKDKIDVISLLAQTRHFADKNGAIGLVIIENLQQIIWPESRSKTTTKEIDAITTAIRAFSLEMKVPFYISSQLGGDVDDREDKRPRIGDLKYKGETADIADKVILLYRPNYYEKKNIDGPEPGEITIAKGGQPLILDFEFDGSCLCWKEKKQE